jgi:DNA-binding MarR family transcriptional regulator
MNTKNHSDDIAYRLLDEFSREAVVSQRALADRLGIALGLVNAYIKRLYKKGYIKIKFLPKNRIKYMLTPHGFAEKTRLTYNYMHYSILYFKDIRQKVESTYREMVAKGVARILLWGDGEMAELCFISTRGLPIEIVGAVGTKKSDHAFFNLPVYTVEDLPEVEYDAILIAALEEKVPRQLKNLGIKPEKIYYVQH